MASIITSAGPTDLKYLCGWGVKDQNFNHIHSATDELVREQFDLWGSSMPKFSIKGGRPYQAGGRMMLWEVGRKLIKADPLNYPQEVGDCFKAGTYVNMADGSRKRIEAVQVGDRVVTPQGNTRSVTRLIEKPYTGYLHTIKAKGAAEEVTATADHRFIQVPYVHHDWKHDESDWLTLSEFEVGDRVLMPYGLDNRGDFESITLRDPSPRCRQIPDSILLDDRFGRLFGLYLAEGSIKYHSKSDTPCGIRFSLGNHEPTLADEIVELIQHIFGVPAKWKKRKNKNVLIVDCNNVNVGRLFHQLCAETVYNKFVPSVFFRSNRLVRLAVVRGWHDGDAGVSASRRLLDDMWRLSLSCGLRPRHSMRRKEAHQRVASGQVKFYGEALQVISPQSVSGPTRNLRDSNAMGWAPAVKTVSKEYVEDHPVYCLEVEEDHAFIANGYAVHNCVSFGAKNAIEYVQFLPMANGERLNWTMAFPPYLWGCGRIFIGKNQLGRQDGSVGVWQAKACEQYGMIAKDAPGVPQYSGSVARQWGNRPGPEDKWVTLGKEHLIKTTALITTWEDFVQAIMNGYPVTVASNVGYTMSVQRDGFHHRQGSWGHQMCFIGVDDDPSDPYACLLNSWGDIFGEVKDFKTGEIWPKGTLRVRKRDVLAQLSEGDSFAYSSFVGFPAQELTRDEFNLW
jgi:hypothetical protein